jgi:hypothetical protein
VNPYIFGDPADHKEIVQTLFQAEQVLEGLRYTVAIGHAIAEREEGKNTDGRTD